MSAQSSTRSRTRSHVSSIKAASAGSPLQTIGICFFLALIVVAVFAQTLRYDFVNYDDDRYVYDNPRTAAGLTPANIRWAFTHVQVANWHPLTMISHMLDCQLYGLHAWGHHLTNILLHTVAAILLLLALRALTGSLWPSAFVAAIFSIHPLRVESVAWVAERKDVLSGIFFMLTLLAYARYARDEGHRKRNYLTVIIWFALGLLSKPTVVTLPFVLLLLDYWPLRRMQIGRREEPGDKNKAVRGKRKAPVISPCQSVSVSAFKDLVIEKIPLFILAAASCVITIFAQAGSLAMMEDVNFTRRATNAIVSYVQYLGQTVYPAHLSVLYPYAQDQLPVVTVLLALIFLGAVSAAFLLWRQRFPFLLVGWLWFLGMLIPMIGLIQVGSQARADRYTYLPAIGLYILATWGAVALFTKWRYGSRLLATVSIVFVAALAVRSYFENSYWQNSETLWRHAVAATSNNYIAHNNLANVFLHKGQTDEAIAEAMNALAAGPNLAEAEGTLGNSYVQKGDIMNAVAHYERALELRPNYAEVQSNLGSVLLDKGDVDEAILHYEKALAVEPDYAGLHNNLGNALLGRGDTDAAITQFRKARAIDPNLPDAHNNFAIALFKKTALDAAIDQFQRAVTIKPDYPEAQYNLGIAFAAKRNYSEAKAHFSEALRLRPNYAEAKDRLRELGAQSP